MCSFVGMIFNRKIESNFEKEMVEECLKYNLFDKGGDSTNILLYNRRTQNVKLFENINNNFNTCLSYANFKNEVYQTDLEDSVILAFSRLTPEMETTSGRIPPYKTIFGNYITAHGTIPLKDLDLDIIDTEILKFDESIVNSIDKVERLNGKISMIEFDPKSDYISGVHNGLGLSYISFGDLFVGLTNTVYETFMKRERSNYYNRFLELVNVREIEPNELITIYRGYKCPKIVKIDSVILKDEVVVSLCSGGLDAVFSTTDYIMSSLHNEISKIKKVDVCYFDWDTRAVDKEVDACGNFIKLLDEISDNTFKVDLDVIPAKSYFKEILNFANKDKIRLCDPDAIGAGENEAEEAISYVPLRNTYLLLALVAKYEDMYPNEKVTFIFGGNLTEGMVYSDNSVNYIEKMNQLVKVAGQKTSNFQIVAPFAKSTKTKMIGDFRNIWGEKLTRSLIDLSFSCYFPDKDGNTCNECGSCKLRSAALNRSYFHFAEIAANDTTTQTTN